MITLLCAATAGVQSANAATITVMNTNDSGPGSLRQALTEANDGDTIDFSIATPATITLTSGDLLVNKSITITGPGADQLSVDGNAADRVFYISSGKTVTISGLTITDGSANGSYPDDLGAGIFNDHATLTVSNCILSANSADGAGGGILNDGSFGGSATLTINNSTVSGNSSGGGGGISNVGAAGFATLTLNNSTLSDNSSEFAGGGVDCDATTGFATLTINNSTLSGNAADGPGGGISTFGVSGFATVTISNSTVSGNSAGDFGGGIYNVDGLGGFATLTINNSTLSGNSSTVGGGIYNFGELGGGATLTIGDTILKNDVSGENIVNDSGGVISLGYNVSSDNGGGFLTAIGDQINTDPMLGPLQDNGGPTFTHELLTGSPAIDAGNPNFIPPPDYDQRGPGYPRVVNGRIDIGSFEVQSSPSCSRSQGYWKNHPGQWPTTTLQLGNVTYDQQQLLDILHQPVRGNGLVLLAHQLIAAKLNIANGADASCIHDTIAAADASIGDLVVPPVGNGYLAPRDVSALAETLDQYNEGFLCAPSCEGNGSPTPTATPRARPTAAPRPR
jgi:hypothetical protein